MGSKDGETDIDCQQAELCGWVKPWDLVESGILLQRVTINHVYGILETNDPHFLPFETSV